MFLLPNGFGNWPRSLRPFEVVNTVEEKAKRADPQKVEWDQVITLSVKPDQRQVDSPLQLYLDLVALSGRGKDAAEEVFARELRPLLTGGESKSGGEQ